MHEAQSKEPVEPVEKQRAARQRPFRFYAVIKHRQIDLETNQPKPQEVLEFDDKAAMRAKLESPDYDTAEVRVIRGYELTVKAKRNFSIN